MVQFDYETAIVNASRDMADLVSCQVCAKIVRAFHWHEIPDDEKQDYYNMNLGPDDEKEDYYYINLGTLSDIIKLPCPHADWVFKVWESIHEDKPAAPQHWSACISFYFGATIMFDLDGKPESSRKRQIRLVSSPDKPGHPGTARVLDPQWSDPSILRAWYSTCQEEHGKDCQEQAVVRSRQETIAMPEWLVDVVEQCIVPCDANISRYIALSYTWGGVECLKHTRANLGRLTERGSLYHDQLPGIPRTVRDAMGITRLLGERYLWVDSLCVDQDEDTASKDLNCMHNIYHNSILCLVAWAGTDANHGLRGIQGISAPRHIKQMVLNIAGGERVSCLLPQDKHQLGAAEGSHYNQRGWTYQEYLFAKRRLIFTDGPLLWVCGRGRWGEEQHGYLRDHSFNKDLASTSWMKEPFPDFIIIQDAAQDFNTRYFTYEADTVKAFLGIQNHIGYSFLGGLNHGHPEIFFDISLTWKCHRESELTRRTGLAANSVCGYSPPSWSWMGWRGKVSFPVDEEYAPDESDYMDGFTHSVAQWFTMHSPLASASDMRPVNCRWNDCKTAVEKDPTQIPAGWRKVTLDSEDLYKRVPRDQGDYVTHEWTYGYPVPLPPSTSANEPIEQRPLLFARTTRAYFTAKDLHATSEADYLGLRTVLVELVCRSGERAGFLELHRRSDAHNFKTSEAVELVAVVKGWTREFSEYLAAFQEEEEYIGWQGSSVDDDTGSERAESRYSTGSDTGSEREESKWSIGGEMVFEREESRWSTGGEMGSEREESRHSIGSGTGSQREESRHSCYFVLCVEWQNGVARRVASGKVEAEIWEQHQEPVDLILG